MNDKGFFSHPNAIVDSADIGHGTRIWAFAHVMKGARIGRNCNIGEACFIEGGVKIGDDVVVKNGVSIWEGVELGDRTFIGPNAVFTNDLIPRSKVFKPCVPTRVCRNASIGANATIICGVEVGEYAVVGAGAVVTRDVPAYSLVFGNPARVRAHVCRCGGKLQFSAGKAALCGCGCEYEIRGGEVFLVAEGEPAQVSDRGQP